MARTASHGMGAGVGTGWEWPGGVSGSRVGQSPSGQGWCVRCQLGAGVGSLGVEPPPLQVVSHPSPSAGIFPHLPSSGKSVIKIFKN